jgi:Na+-transporting NADH:ubiquinone oxidoreductase subunit NqrC
MNKFKIFAVVLFILLIASNIFFAVKYFLNVKQIKQIKQEQQINSDVLSFTKLFVDKVLMGSKEVSFEDRLQLENSIRALKDKEAFDLWDKFTKAKEQTEIQSNFYDLFSLLLTKIKS